MAVMAHTERDMAELLEGAAVKHEVDMVPLLS